MAYFNIKETRYIPQPIPSDPPYNPPIIPEQEAGSIPDIPRGSYYGDINIYLFKVYDDDKTLFKNKESEYVLSGAFKEDIDLLHPIFTIETDVDLTQFNYCYISALGRYYFMKVNLLKGQLYECVCDVDALSTFANDLLIIPCIIDREEQHNGLYIDGGTFVAGTKDYSKIYNFSNGFNDQGTNILICCGGE